MHRNKIAFYAPLKSPEHNVPSGDRLMARSLIECLQHSGYRVQTISHLRALVRDPHHESANEALLKNVELERERISMLWRYEGPPECWFCYHPYYKSPDLLGPPLCREFNLPYVTAEASYSKRRNEGFWRLTQAHIADAVNLAAVNLYFTQRDYIGLKESAQTARFLRLRPFIHPMTNRIDKNRTDPLNLVTVAMMRSGDKWNSYVHLASALLKITDVPWNLHIVGDGPQSLQVRALFDDIPSQRVIWHGEKTPSEIVDVFSDSALFVWPGCGEAYGLAYLEAQSAGLPVVAFNTAGVPEVVDNGHSGILVKEGDDNAYAHAIRRLLTDANELSQMSVKAQQHVLEKHTFLQASDQLGKILEQVITATK